MKKLKGMRVLSVVMVSLFLVLFTACGNKANSAVVGKWTVTKVEVGGISVTLEEFSETYGQDVSMVFDFTSEGKVTGEVMGESAEGTYKVNGTNVDLTLDGETQTLTLSGNEMTIEMDGVKMTLTKA